MPKSYRIVKLRHKVYRVERRERFLFIPYWNKKVKHRLIGLTIGVDEEALFYRKKDAKKFIKRHKENLKKFRSIGYCR